MKPIVTYNIAYNLKTRIGNEIKHNYAFYKPFIIAAIHVEIDVITAELNYQIYLKSCKRI